MVKTQQQQQQQQQNKQIPDAIVLKHSIKGKNVCVSEAKRC